MCGCTPAPIEVEAPTRGAEHGAASLVDVAHDGEVQSAPLVRVEAFVSVLDAVDGADLVGSLQGGRDLTDHIVEPRAQAATGNDCRDHVG